MRKPTVKKILLVVTVVVIATACYLYREYNRKPSDMTDVTPAMRVTAAKLVADYDLDETKANQLYLGKTIEVTGAVADIMNQQDTLINISIGDAASMHKVNALLDVQHADLVKSYSKGQAIIVKGICTGYLLDVELNRCVIVTGH